MSFDANTVVLELKKVNGWKNFWDVSEIPALGSPLNDSESGEHYQNYSGAVRLDYIKALLAPNRPLTTYLDTVQTESITQLLNDIETKKQIGNVGKDIASSEIVFDIGKKNVTETNQGRFCGVMFEVKNSTGIRATINRIGMYLTTAVTDLDLYLFHSSKEEVVSQFTFTSTLANSFAWQVQEVVLNYDDGVNTGGTWYLGYYQDDLGLQSSAAISYKAMNWIDGYCNICNADTRAANVAYKSIRSRVTMSGFYVPGASLPVSKTERFDPTTAIVTNNLNWGLNFHISVGCNLTQFWIENRRNLNKVIGLKVAMKVLEMMKFSARFNSISESVQHMIIRDLEGSKDTDANSMKVLLEDAIDALVLDQGNLSKDCLPCARKPQSTIGAVN